jgi:hypothetical protein
VTLRKILAAGVMLVGMTGAALAQSASAQIDFNLFEFEGLYLEQAFNFDDTYTERFGIDVPVPFSVSVPNRDGVVLIADGAPDGGAFVKFTFATDTEPRQFLENIQVVTASIPMAEEAEDPATARIQIAARALQEQVFPQAVEGFDEPQILAIEQINFGDVVGVHLVGTYGDPAIGPMVVRLTMMLNPDAPESYFTISNINATLVPVVDGETLAASLTGRVLNSWVYP